MTYPVPIDAAGRTALVFLCLALVRSEGASWIRSVLVRTIPRSLWLDDLARFGPARVAAHCSLALLRAAGRLLLSTMMVLWSAYAVTRLAYDLAEAPALAVLGGLLGIATCRVVCH